ncbi:MAG: hypothetical protein ABI878_04910 [Acidobacteriota bacterium]
MSLRIIQSFFIFAVVSFVFACGINSVTRAQLEAVQAGDVLTYRFQKDGKSWFYSDKVTRIEGGRVYYNPSRTEATSGRSDIHDFDTRTELSIARADLLNYAGEFGEDKKVIIWINH